MIDVLVIGAGPGGLGAAAELQRRGLEVVVIDRAAALGGTWRSAYDRVRLNTVAWLSYLPRHRLPRAAGRWPSRDAFVAYLERYAQAERLDIRLGIAAQRLERAGGRWRVTTDHGEFVADQVVVATGYSDWPAIPAWPGRELFAGELMHSSQYRNGGPFTGKSALVVGAGNSGAEIAVDLADAGVAVMLSIRTAPHVVVRSFGPLPTQLMAVALRRAPVCLADPLIAHGARLAAGDLTALGLPRPAEGAATRARRDGAIPIIDAGLVDALRADRLRIVPAVKRLTPNGAILADGRQVTVDVIIAATGYHAGLATLVAHLGVLDHRGLPTVHGARTHLRAPGLRFIGFTNPISGNLREIRLDARRIAAAAARDSSRHLDDRSANQAMNSQINAHLAPTLVAERRRTAHCHRSGQLRAYSMPVDREIPRPACPEAPSRDAHLELAAQRGVPAEIAS